MRSHVESLRMTFEPFVRFSVSVDECLACFWRSFKRRNTDNASLVEHSTAKARDE
jgi:hypothetical protein